MDNSVIKLEDYRPSPTLLIQAGKTQHVYPVAYFESIVKGDAGVEPIPDDVLRVIVGEWLQSLVGTW
jgi:hypothetical protein